MGEAGVDGLRGEKGLPTLSVVVSGYDDGLGLRGRVVLRQVSCSLDLRWVKYLRYMLTGGSWGVWKEYVDKS